MSREWEMFWKLTDSKERPHTILNLDGDILMEPLREIHEQIYKLITLGSLTA